MMVVLVVRRVKQEEVPKLEDEKQAVLLASWCHTMPPLQI
jgi:hypothetical protein